MNSRDFVYWLQGLFELGDPKELNEKQTNLIKRHLNMVFYHEIDPSMGDKEHQGKLQALHDGASKLTGEKLTSQKNQVYCAQSMTEDQDGTQQEMFVSTVEGQSNTGMTSHLHELQHMSKEELDKKYGVGIRPRC